MQRWIVAGAVVAQLLASTGPVNGQATEASDSFSDAAREIAALRAEVDALDRDLSLRRDRAVERLRSLDMQAEELELLVDRERLALADLERARADAASRRDADAALAARLDTVLGETIDALAARVRAGIPFRRGDRTAALDELRADLVRADRDPSTMFARVWRFVEDELQLARTWGRARVPVPIAGEDVMVDAFRVGLVALYVRTPDGRVGRSMADGTMSFVDGAVAAEIERLLDDAAKRRPNDVYALPLEPAR